MLDFKSYLEEGRDAPLYHGTTLKFGMKILNMNELVSRRSWQDEGTSVSFSRNIKHARYLTIMKNAAEGHIIFELDQRKLAQRYKIVPVNDRKLTRDKRPMYSHNGNNEFEERIKGDIKDVSKYILKLYIFKRPGTISESEIDGLLLDYPVLKKYQITWNYK